MLLFVPPSFGSVVEVRNFIASSWYEICGELCEDHLLAGTRVEEVQSWKRAMSYVEKYVAKPERFPEGDRDGQDLGDVERGGAPRPVGDSKSDPQRRLQDQENLRKAGKDGGRGRLHCLTVLVRHENVIRLLGFLGYRQEE